MKFEVLNGNNPVFYTEYRECVPTIEELKSMYKHGYTFKLNNKKIILKRLEEYINKGC